MLGGSGRRRGMGGGRFGWRRFGAMVLVVAAK